MDISVLEFYGYIGYIGDMDIFFQILINPKLFKINILVFIFYINISLS